MAGALEGRADQHTQGEKAGAGGACTEGDHVRGGKSTATCNQGGRPQYKPPLLDPPSRPPGRNHRENLCLLFQPLILCRGIWHRPRLMRLFGDARLNFPLFADFPHFLLSLRSNFTLFWPENILCMISALLFVSP